MQKEKENKMKKTWIGILDKNVKMREDQLLKLFEEAKKLAPEYTIICHPKSYSPSQKLVSSFIEYFLEDTKVIWSTNDRRHKRVCVYCTDTKEKGAFLQSNEAEDNWDQIASIFFKQELQTFLCAISDVKLKPASQLFLNQILEQAQKILIKNENLEKFEMKLEDKE